MKSPRRSTIAVATLISLAVILFAELRRRDSWIVEQWTFLSRTIEIARLQRQYPFESVAPRLDYETRQANLRSQEAKLSPRSVQFLSEEDERPRSARAESLFLLHAETTDEFIKTFGNGLSRTPRPGPERLDLAPAEPVNFDQPMAVSAASESSRLIAIAKDDVPAGLNPWRAPSENHLAQFHQLNQGFFTSDWNTGYARDREHVAGFIGHVMHGTDVLNGHSWESYARHRRDRKIDRLTTEDIRSDKWVVTRLELVSLLKHDMPQVYLSEHLPNMEELRNVQTRPLNNFEQPALAGLENGEDVIVQATLNHIQMLGSLRAGKKCLECHTAEHGQLLGAFSYDLWRDEPFVEQPKN